MGQGSKVDDVRTLAALITHIRREELKHSAFVPNRRIELIAYFTAAWHFAIYGTLLFPQCVFAEIDGPVIADFTRISSLHQGRDSETLSDTTAYRLATTLCSAYRNLATEEILRSALIKNSAWSIARLGAPAGSRVQIYPEIMKNFIWLTAGSEISALPE